MIVKIYIVLFICLMINSAFAQNSTHSNINSNENILKFAGFLFDIREYNRAANEYERYLFQNNSHPDSIKFRIGLCHLYGKDYERAIDKFSIFVKDSSRSILYNRALFNISYIKFELHRYEQSLDIIANRKKYIDNDVRDTDVLHLDSILDANKFNLLIAANNLILKNWKDSEIAINKISESDSFPGFNHSFNNLLTKGKELNEKNPYLASGLSTILPGLGKVYAGNTIDGLFSFLLHGFTTWQAYEGFSENKMKSVKGWLFAGIGTVFYLGNIYGSYISVEIHNREINNDFNSQIHLELRKILDY
ncbi:MAG: hypothetical protein HW421_2189 [Ignavibacteria bacterium]|nr:hypothetical protein [Ignavibacteria bacterium]